jgi:hypothetical protein
LRRKVKATCKIMDTKQIIRVYLTRRIAATGLLLCTLLAAGSLQAQDKAKGEEMLRRARAEFAEANQLSEAAVAATQKAQEDQEAATHKRDDAMKLQREAFLLIRDSNRMRAAEARARADEEELQLKSENLELARLNRLLAHQQQVAGDYASGAVNVRNIANKESNPAEKAELTKMADSLDQQATQAIAAGAPTNQRIIALSTEINRLTESVHMLRQAAQRLAPEEK